MGGTPGTSGYLLVDNPQDFAGQIIRLLLNQDYICQLGEASRKMIMHYHDIQVVTSLYEECLTTILISRN